MNTRVLLDVSAIPPQRGGVGTYVHELLRELPDAGVEATVLTRKGDRRVWNGAHGMLRLVPNHRPTRLAWEKVLLTTSVRRASVGLPSVMHSPHYTMPLLLDRKWRPARVVTIHDLTFFTRPGDHSSSKRVLFRHAIKQAVTRSDAVIAVSQTTADVLTSLLRVRVPVHVIPHGIDHGRFRTYTNELESVRERELLTQHGVEGNFILHLGTIEPRKNLEGLLRAYEALGQKSTAPQPTLVLAGSAWPGEWERLEPLAKRLGDMSSNSNQRVRIVRLGEVPDELVAPLYRAASVVAYPSFEEGFGLPILEALACGAPVVTSHGSVMEDIAGASIVTVDPNNFESIARGIHVALEEQADTRIDRTRRGLAVAKEYGWNRCAHEHAQVYRSLQ
jgi:glycosyltransferase involved in cell wall biosynthesis